MRTRAELDLAVAGAVDLVAQPQPVHRLLAHQRHQPDAAPHLGGHGGQPGHVQLVHRAPSRKPLRPAVQIRLQLGQAGAALRELRDLHQRRQILRVADPGRRHARREPAHIETVRVVYRVHMHHTRAPVSSTRASPAPPSRVRGHQGQADRRSGDGAAAGPGDAIRSFGAAVDALLESVRTCLSRTGAGARGCRMRVRVRLQARPRASRTASSVRPTTAVPSSAVMIGR